MKKKIIPNQKKKINKTVIFKHSNNIKYELVHNISRAEFNFHFKVSFKITVKIYEK